MGNNKNNFCAKTKILISLLALFSFAKAQTNVSGGIYTNTTWTKANSPYIVVDTVVVFPGVKLTIQPGVTVKFVDNQCLEIRQGQIIAAGTANDSIIFTSNSTSPNKGKWKNVYVHDGSLPSQFSFCVFKYAETGIVYFLPNTVLPIKNLTFISNINGLSGSSISADSCNFKNNDKGWVLKNYFFSGMLTNTINSCSFSYNGSGIEDPGGISGTVSYVSGCDFTNNTFGLKLLNARLILTNSLLNYNGSAVYAGGSGPVTVGGTISASSINYNSYAITNGYFKIYNSSINHNNTAFFQSGSSIISSDSICFNINGFFSAKSCTINNNIVEHNTKSAVDIGGGNTIISNSIRYNGVGIIESTGGVANIIKGNSIEYDSVGLSVGIPSDIIQCNKICSNSAFDLKFTGSSNTSGNNYGNNYWCTTDSASTAVKIYDGYDNATLGLVNFMPLDNTQCYLSIGIKEFERDRGATLFPNPSTGVFIIEFGAILSGRLTLTNAMGETVYSEQLIEAKQKEITLDAAPGIYFIKVETVNGSFTKKIIIQK